MAAVGDQCSTTCHADLHESRKHNASVPVRIAELFWSEHRRELRI